MKTGRNQKNAQRSKLRPIEWGPAGCQCDLCHEEPPIAPIVVVNVQTRRERFSCDSPLVALMLAVNLGEPVIITTEKMTRENYELIPLAQRPRILGELVEDLQPFEVDLNLVVGTIA